MFSSLSVDSNGQVYIAGQDGGVYKRECSSWSESMETDAKRIAVTPNGKIFIVTNYYEVNFLSRTDTEWKSYAMTASDVSAGAIAPDLCPVGKYGTVVGASTDAAGCSDCPGGYYCASDVKT